MGIISLRWVLVACRYCDDEGTTVKLLVGGRTGVYWGAMVLPATSAFDIAERFLLSGPFDPALKWVEDCLAD